LDNFDDIKIIIFYNVPLIGVTPVSVTLIIYGLFGESCMQQNTLKKTAYNKEFSVP
jgi:hypothetical protein